jgi:hypothetical protein
MPHVFRLKAVIGGTGYVKTEYHPQMTDRVFVDTNRPICKKDPDAGQNHERAAFVISDLWEKESPIVGVRVRRESHVNAIRKIPKLLLTHT